MKRLLEIDHNLRVNVNQPLVQATVLKSVPSPKDFEDMRTEIENAGSKIRECWADLSSGLILCYKRLFPERELENDVRCTLQRYIDHNQRAVQESNNQLSDSQKQSTKKWWGLFHIPW
jgi:hypothetical protein